jgi:hypothetical protein
VGNTGTRQTLGKEIVHRGEEKGLVGRRPQPPLLILKKKKIGLSDLHAVCVSLLPSNCSMAEPKSKVKVKISLLQAMEAHRVARG